MTPEERLSRSWRLFRCVRKVNIVSILGAGLLPVGGIIVLKNDYTSPLLDIGEGIFGVCLILFVCSLLWMMFWPCPRCRRPFASKGYSISPILAKCRHCGLPFGAKDIDSKVL
jgi:hypothetical protein